MNVEESISYLGKKGNIKFLKKLENYHLNKILLGDTWFEFYFLVSRNIKTVEGIKNFYFSKLKIFFNFLNFKFGKIRKVHMEIFGNFYIFSIDEYVIGRKNAISINPFEKSWGGRIWKHLEDMFQIVLENTKKKELFSIFLISFKSFRYDKFATNVIFFEKLLKFFYFIIKSKFSLISKTHYIYIKKIFEKLFFFLLSKNVYKNQNGKSDDFGHLVKIFFLKKVFIFYKLFKTIFFKKYHFKIRNSENLCHFFHQTKFFNPNFFFIKKYTKALKLLFITCLIKKIQKDLADYKFIEYSKKMLNSKGKKKIFWVLNFKNGNLSNMLKVAAIFGFGCINFSTRNSTFLSQNLKLFNKISFWTKFITGASIGAIFRGDRIFYNNFFDSLKKRTVSDFLKAGILIDFCFSKRFTVDFEKVFINKMQLLAKGKIDPILRYSTCIGLSFIGRNRMNSTKKSFLLKFIKNFISLDMISASGSALAIGILFLGSNSRYLLEVIISLIQETEYAKIGKILVFSLAFIFLKTKDESNLVFQTLIRERNPQIREGAVYIYSLAFLGSGDFQATNKILEILSLDPDENVKKAAIISIGFIFMCDFENIKSIFYLAINHYNPFVRYGLCFAIMLSVIKGIYIQEANIFLKKLCNDPVDFVRQGAYISMGFIFSNVYHKKKKKEILKNFEKILKDEKESPLIKFGIMIGYGILESNKNYSFAELEGNVNSSRFLIGLFNFINYWGWIPNIYFYYLTV
jgi:hypothetical protein